MKIQPVNLSLVAFTIVIFATLAIYKSKDYDKGAKGYLCSAEAKICLDGSAVERTGPNCEFSRCPDEVKTPHIVETNKDAEFGKPVSLAVGKIARYKDGLELNLKEINDSRCYPTTRHGTLCVWAGEISALFTARYGNFASVSKEIRLGTVNNSSVSWKNYTFSLADATPEIVTIVVQIVVANENTKI